MKKIVEYTIAIMVRIALWFRYRIRIVGFENLTPENLNRPGGVLFLPNHPTYFVDPCIAALAVWPQFPLRPMIVEYMYYTPGIHTVMKIMDALPVPNFGNSSNSLKKKKSEQVIQTVIDNIKKGQNFLIAPGGKVKYAGYEPIAGSAVHKILQETPEANIVLMRMKGLWGSSFSRALEQESPSFGAAILGGLKIILKNLVFFTPRREVTVELVPAPKDFPRDGTRLEINKYLEAWYNQPDGLTKQQGEEPGDSLMLVSYSMWKDEFLPPKENKEVFEEDVAIKDIPETIRTKVLAKLSELTEIPQKSILPEQTLSADLGLDSLDTAEVVTFLNDQFDVEGVPAKELTTVSRVMAIAAGKVSIEEDVEEEQSDIRRWNGPREKTRAAVAQGNTIAEVFLNQCEKTKKAVACADERIGIQTLDRKSVV